MAVGGIGGLMQALVPLVGVITILRSRRKARAEREVEHDSVATRREGGGKRRNGAAEMERRMAAYLAGRDAGRADAAPPATDRRTDDERG